jgi:hypothetical protein
VAAAVELAPSAAVEVVLQVELAEQDLALILVGQLQPRLESADLMPAAAEDQVLQGELAVPVAAVQVLRVRVDRQLQVQQTQVELAVRRAVIHQPQQQQQVVQELL